MLPLTRQDHRIDNSYQIILQIILQIIRSQDVIYLIICLLDHEVSQLIPKLLQFRSFLENDFTICFCFCSFLSKVEN